MKPFDWQCPICGADLTLPRPTAKPLQVVIDLIVKHLEEHRIEDRRKGGGAAPVLIPTEHAG